MQILTAQEMADADRRSVEAGLSIHTLMQRAGAAVAAFCQRHYPGDGLVVILAGKGNNGGDGLVAAHHLAVAGRPVRVVLLASRAELADEPRKVLQALLHAARPAPGHDPELPAGAAAKETTASSAQQPLGPAGQASVELHEIVDEPSLRAALADATLFVDAVVGTGFKPPLRGLAATARDLVAVTATPVVAVDLPSGWDADSTSQASAEAFRADAVVTFVRPKLAHIFGQLTTGVFGPVVVAGLGEPEAAVVSTTGLHWAGASKAIAEAPRGVDGNKGKFGHVLLIGGAFGKAGAPSMASLAAMRAGAGLVTAAVPREVLPTVAAIAPELMLTPLATAGEPPGLDLGGLAAPALEALLQGITVVAIGPGLGQAGSTPAWVRTFVERVALPLVIDADALNAIAGRLDLLTAIAANRTVVLTPHPGEMARLIGGSVPQVEADRIQIARRFATRHGVTLVLKGWRTLIAHPDGRIAVNTTGNPSMAKGGSGDILTGIVAAMLAQYANLKVGTLDPAHVAQAVEAAVFLHGLAGDFACLAQDEHTVLATDTVDHLWKAFRARVTGPAGLTWITGGTNVSKRP